MELTFANGTLPEEKAPAAQANLLRNLQRLLELEGFECRGLAAIHGIAVPLVVSHQGRQVTVGLRPALLTPDGRITRSVSCPQGHRPCCSMNSCRLHLAVFNRRTTDPCRPEPNEPQEFVLCRDDHPVGFGLCLLVCAFLIA